MRTKFYLDKRGQSKALVQDTADIEPSYQIKIAINHGGSSAYLPTGVFIQESKWLSKPNPGQVVGCVQKDRLNIILSEKKLAVDKVLEEMRAAGELRGLSLAEIREKVSRKLELSVYDTDNGEVPIVVCFERFIRTKSNQGTIEGYNGTMAKLMAYREFSEKTTFRSINPSWLDGFNAYLARTNLSVNSRAIHSRNIRAVFNFALNEELTSAPYPFKRYKIKTEPTKDRSLTKDEMGALRDAKCNPTSEKYRDLFFLSFYLCGMNLEDILALKGIRAGRVETKRIKTGQLLTIGLVPEALYIINKYKGIERLVGLGEGVNYDNFQRRVNRALKRIGQTYNPHTREWEGEPLIPDISFYWARFTWATAAGEIDIPEKTVGAAMGHGTSKSVTSIYMRVDMRKKVDAANRAVIDYVFPKNLETKK